MLVPMRGPMMLNDVTNLMCPLLGVARQQGDGPRLYAFITPSLLISSKQFNGRLGLIRVRSLFCTAWEEAGRG